MATVRFLQSGDTLYAHLAGEIDHDSAQLLRLSIDSRADACMPRVLVLDLAGISFMDSSGVGLILGRLRRMQAAGGSLRVAAAPPAIQRMLRLAHIEYEEAAR